MSEKLKLIIGASAAAFVLLLAMLLPLAFKGAGPEEIPADLGERAALFADYWRGDTSVKKKIESEPSNQQIKQSMSVLQEVVDSYVLDQKLKSVEATGREILTISNENCSIDLCRVWMEQQGDWQNWIDVVFDVDTGDIYYLYISSECLFNGNEYLGAVDQSFDTKTVADMVGEIIGYPLQYLGWSGNPGDTATALYVAEGNAVCVEIGCSYYESTLIDVKICCV